MFRRAFVVLPVVVPAILILHSPAAVASQTLAEVRSLAAEVLAKEQTSTNRATLIAACSTTSVPAPDCTARLRAIANDVGAAMPTRLAAAAGLAMRQEPKAAEQFDTLARSASFDHLLQILKVIERLPSAAAAPPLVRLLESGDDRFAVPGARALGGVRTTEAVSALHAAVSRYPPVSPVWLAANTALARLGDADGLRVAGSTHPYLGPEDLLAAGEGFHTAGDPRAEPFLLLVTRKSEGITRLRAAALMADRRPEQFQKFLAETLASPDPVLRAEAIDIAGRATPALSPEISKFLRDPDATVRVRAADLILSKTPERGGR